MAQYWKHIEISKRNFEHPSIDLGTYIAKLYAIIKL